MNRVTVPYLYGHGYSTNVRPRADRRGAAHRRFALRSSRYVFIYIRLEEIASGEFVQTLVSKNDPKRLIAPSKVAKMAENEEQMKEIVKTVGKERASMNNNIINNATRKTTGTKKNNADNEKVRRNSSLG